MILADFPNIYLHGAGSKISLNSLAFTMFIIGVHTMSFSYAPQKNETFFLAPQPASSGVLAHPVIRLLGARCKICTSSQPVHIKSSWSTQKQPTAPSLDESWNHFCSVEAAGLRA